MSANNTLPVDNIRQIEGPVSHLPVAQSETASVLSMIERVARDPSVNMDKMMQLMEWRKEMLAEQRRIAFEDAMSAAQAEIPTITKNRLVHFEAKNGGKDTSYRHEDMAEIVETIRPILHKHGLSHRFRTHQDMQNGGLITVTCVISGHGHREETPLSSGPDQNSSGMNNLQRIASAVTYLERYTLKAALGLAASTDDDGGAGGNDEPAYVPPEGAISADQVACIRDALAKKGASERAFLGWAKQKRIEDIPADLYDACMDGIASFKKSGK